MYRRERHSVTDLKTHLVCVTKYRKPVFNDDGLKLIEESFKTVATKMNFQILEFNGEADQVHALIEYPPKLCISQIANALKGVSSRRYGQAGNKKPHKEALWGFLFPACPYRRLETPFKALAIWEIDSLGGYSINA